MTLQIITDYKIAVGHNNAGGLVAVTSLVDALGVVFLDPRGITEDTPGVEQPAPGGGLFYNGLPSTQWLSAVTLEQHKYLWATFINVATRGAVTIRTPGINTTAFANFDAWLRIPSRRELSGSYNHIMGGSLTGMGWTAPMVWSLSRMVAL